MTHKPNSRALRWLRGALPELVASGVITAETSAAIAHYYDEADSGRANFGFVILASVGAALVGAGIILLIAHNWDEFSRATRTTIAFLPLLIAQALVAFVLLRRNESKPWRELVAIFDVAAVGTAISLVGQTYQIQGTFAEFMRGWLLLSIPIVYLLRSTLGAVVYTIGAVVWLMNHSSFFWGATNPNFFWLLVLLVLPYFWLRFRDARDSRETAALAIILAIAAVFGVGPTAEFAKANVGGIAYAGLVTGLYLWGMKFFPRGDGRLHPLALLGGIGIGVTALVLSFEDIWHMGATAWETRPPGANISLAIELFFPLAAIALAIVDLARRRANFSISAAMLPIVAGLGYWMANPWGLPNERWQETRSTFGAAMLLNGYVLWLGIDIIARGIRANSIARANFGLLLIAGLALCRFFDGDLSFVTRGVGFIVVGAGFLVANFVFFKKRATA